jgi:CRP/FNR family transcriptional regulator
VIQREDMLAGDNGESLMQVPLLRHLKQDQQVTVAAAGSARRLAKGEILFHEGEPAEALYAVLSGQMKLVRYSPAGKEMLLHLVRPGQSFADAALFGEGTYPATAEATEGSLIWCLPRQRLAELIRASPELGLAMVASVSMWTRRLAGKMEILTQRRVEERLAIYILGRSGGRRVEPGGWVELTEPRHLIAAQCGTAPEVLSRTFKRLEEEGVLRAEPKRVQVLDPEKLYALAEWIGD